MNRKVMASVSAAVLLAICAPAQQGPESPKAERASGQDEARLPAKVRLRAFLRAHPEVFHRLKESADQDGDGKLSPEERARFLELAHRRMEENARLRQDRRADRQENRQDRIEDRQENRQDRREDRQENRQDRRRARGG